MLAPVRLFFRVCRRRAPPRTVHIAMMDSLDSVSVSPDLTAWVEAAAVENSSVMLRNRAGRLARRRIAEEITEQGTIRNVLKQQEISRNYRKKFPPRKRK